MKPRISIDERGVSLHVPKPEGGEVSLLLEPDALVELYISIGATLKTKSAQRWLAGSLGRVLANFARRRVEGGNDGG